MGGVDIELTRARNEFGQFVGDDPATIEVNEAWVPVSTETNDTSVLSGGEV